MRNAKSRTRDFILMLCLAVGGICFLFTQCHINYNKDRKLMRAIACAAQLKQIGIAMQEYVREYKSYPYPDGAAGLDLLNIRQYPEWQKLFICPNSSLSPVQETTLDELHCSYYYFSGCNAEKRNPKDIVIIEKSRNHENFYNVMFADGSVTGIIPDKEACLENVLRDSYKDNFASSFRMRQLELARKWDCEVQENVRKKK